MEVIGQYYAHGRFTPGKEPRYPLNRWLDVPQKQCAVFGEEKISCPLRGSFYQYSLVFFLLTPPPTRDLI